MFQDVDKHRFFNTNNLWVRLDMLKSLMENSGGFVPLPTILNSKTVDPQQDTSTPVYQLETAMGAAIECFRGAGAVCVPRSRFAPVKKCSDLFLLRSDAYVINSENVLELSPACKGVAPIVSLDDKKYKMVQQLEEAMCIGGYPSLVQCRKLTVMGLAYMCARNIFVGDVTLANASPDPRALPAGVFEDCTVDMGHDDSYGVLPKLMVKMRQEGLSESAISAFAWSYLDLVTTGVYMIST